MESHTVAPASPNPSRPLYNCGCAVETPPPLPPPQPPSKPCCRCGGLTVRFLKSMGWYTVRFLQAAAAKSTRGRGVVKCHCALGQGIEEVSEARHQLLRQLAAQVVSKMAIAVDTVRSRVCVSWLATAAALIPYYILPLHEGAMRCPYMSVIQASSATLVFKLHSLRAPSVRWSGLLLLGLQRGRCILGGGELSRGLVYKPKETS